jgi:hypothetical protein
MAVANPPNANDFESGQSSWDSLNTDVLEPTGGTVDTTVRPMRESLRKRLKPPCNGLPSQEPPEETPPGPQG